MQLHFHCCNFAWSLVVCLNDDGPEQILFGGVLCDSSLLAVVDVGAGIGMHSYFKQ